ncbi:MAG: DUF2625 family protein [Acidobacteriota bacterium]
MKILNDLLKTDESAITLVREWVAEAEVQCEILPPGENRADILVALQITTRAPLGALAYETGGVLIDHGWLRCLGSGHPRLPRDLHSWNAGRSDGFLLVADDVVGGFFALNGGALGPDLGQLYYWPPADLDWTALDMGFTEFFQFCLSGRLAAFYESLRWPGWDRDTATLAGHACFGFYPFLWTREGSKEGSHRAALPVAEVFDLKVDLVRQLGAEGA